MAVMVIIFVAMWDGAHTRFVPNLLLGGMPGYVSAYLLAAALLVWMRSSVEKMARRGRVSMPKPLSWFSRAILVLLCPVLIGLGIWLVFAMSLPSFYTAFAGEPYSVVERMRVYESTSRRGCEYRLTGDVLGQRAPRHLCVSEAFVRRHGKGELQVRLTGKRTWFGFRILDAQVLLR